ncbi:MAG: GNAT family N-acetyltransferase [Desulfocapsaceae bacterium]|nr:GNAT family N-acetyltransferase [Desulfosporosinus sp.]MDR3629534.1 GNAT family N-acetyltransferase [Desulfocapsaceae bacterium]
MNDTIECFKINELPAKYRQIWEDLVQTCGACRNAFLTPLFCDAVAAAGSDVRTVIVLRHGQAHSILPYQMKPGILGKLGVAERVGGEMSDYFGIVTKDEMHFDVAALLRSARISALEFSHLGETQSTYGLYGESPRKGLTIDLGASEDNYWRSLQASNKKLTSDTERRFRKLIADYGPVQFELQSSRPDDDLKSLIKHKIKQYRRTGNMGAVLFQQKNIDLLFRLLRVNARECTGYISVLKIGDRLIAGHFGLLCYGTLHYWFPVYDQEFHSYSPGRLLLMHLLREGLSAGIRRIDRGEGDAAYKRDFANCEQIYYKGVWTAGYVRSMLGYLALQATWSINERLKKKLSCS